MKTFALIVNYPQNIVELRKPHREAHFAYANGLLAQGKLLYGGPFENPCDGAMILYRAEEIEEVLEMIADDPYAKAGFFDDRQVKEWSILINPLPN